MNNNNTAALQQEKYPYKVLFRVNGNLALIHALSEKGVVIRVDQMYYHACACFDNTIDYNDFKEKMSRISSKSPA